jgi:cytoskeletal protein RodZ
MGVTLAEVEVATRIRQKYLSALEAEEWHLLPGEVVGRGFLRNYADYLGLDPQEIMDRRRATTDSGMTQALSTTSAGAPLPPEREVDYRPKEVELKDEGDGIQRGEIRLTPILAILAVAAVVGLGLWGLAALREPIGAMLASAQVGVVEMFSPSEADPTATTLAIGVVNEENVGSGGENQVAAMAATATAAAQGVVLLGSGATTPGAVALATSGEQPVAPAAAAPAASDGSVVLVPTATPAQVAAAPTAVIPTPPLEAPTATPEIPTATPVPPTPTLEPPTATPEVPTETPTPEPTVAPAVVAASCGDQRSLISGPGVGQVIAGVTPISGVATHESFQFYKLEFAAGANASGGFTYFGGGQVQVAGGVLGNIDTTVLPNGEYTIRLTVVDAIGNFPAPCDVTVVVQN